MSAELTAFLGELARVGGLPAVSVFAVAVAWIKFAPTRRTHEAATTDALAAAIREAMNQAVEPMATKIDKMDDTLERHIHQYARFEGATEVRLDYLERDKK